MNWMALAEAELAKTSANPYTVNLAFVEEHEKIAGKEALLVRTGRALRNVARIPGDVASGVARVTQSTASRVANPVQQGVANIRQGWASGARRSVHGVGPALPPGGVGAAAQKAPAAQQVIGQSTAAKGAELPRITTPTGQVNISDKVPGQGRVAGQGRAKKTKTPVQQTNKKPADKNWWEKTEPWQQNAMVGGGALGAGVIGGAAIA